MKKTSEFIINTPNNITDYCSIMGSPILNNQFLGFVLTDNKGEVLYCNSYTEKLFGYSHSQIIGSNFSKLIPEIIVDDSLKFKIPFDSKFEANGNKKNNEVLFLELTLNEVEDDNSQKYLLFIVNDLTTQHLAEQAKNDFVSTVSHELRTPLTSIKGALDLLLYSAGSVLPDGAMNLLKIAANNSMRLLQLINDILDVQKIEAGKMDFDMEKVQLHDIVEQSINNNSSYAEKYQVSFAFEPFEKECIVYADKARLLQVVTNLLSNAAKFSTAGEEIKIQITKTNSNSYRLSVQDKGAGVPVEFQSKLFQKFSQIPKTNKEGTGLGLNICKKIIEKMNGSIGFNSLEKGSEFFFELPVINDSSKKILICEDDEMQASFISALFAENGYIVDIALSASDAKLALAEKQYDLITMDIILPDQDGISLIKDIYFNSELNKETPVIVISCIVDDFQSELSNKFNIVDFYNKSFSIPSLLTKIKEICDNKDKINILHVEDDEDVIDIVRALLEDFATIIPATTFKAGVDEITNNQYDLVLLDINLPGASGLDLLPIINEKNEETPVIIFSSLDVDENIAKNVSTVLLKTKISNDDLLRTIKSIIPSNSD